MSTATPPRQRTPRPSSRPPIRRKNIYQRFRDNELHFTPGDTNRRMRALALVFVCVLILYGLRLVMVQAVDSDAMAARAESGRLATSTLVAPRGTILDSQGVSLAQSVEARNVIVDQTLITDAPGVAAKLSEVLGLPAADIEKSLIGTKRFNYVTKRISPEEWDRVAALKIPGSPMRRPPGATTRPPPWRPTSWVSSVPTEKVSRASNSPWTSGSQGRRQSQHRSLRRQDHPDRHRQTKSPRCPEATSSSRLIGICSTWRSRPSPSRSRRRRPRVARSC